MFNYNNMKLINDKGILKPAIGTYYNYVDVNNDKNLRKMMIDYFRKKTLKWLEKDYDDITNCYKIIKNKVVESKNCNNNNNINDTKKIADHIYQIVYQKKLIKKVLFKFVKLSETNWYDLKLEKKRIKKLIKYIIKKKILSSE